MAPLWMAVRRSASPTHARLLGFVAGFLYFASVLRWMWTIHWILALGTWWLMAVFMGVVTGVVKRWETRYQPSWWNWCFVAAGAWLVVEVFRAEMWSLRFGMAALGYTQSPNAAVRYWGSVIGVYGLSFVMVWVNAAVAMGWEAWREARKGWVGPWVAAGLVYGLLAWPTLQPAPSSKVIRDIKVAAVQDEQIDLHVHERLTRDALSFAPQLVVWPEYGVELTPSWKGEAVKRMGAMALEARATLVAGCMTFLGVNAPKKFENHTVVFDPDGRELGRYVKMHPIQFIEGMMTAGKDARPIQTAAGLIATPICYDMDYSDVVRKFSENGAQLIATPNMDPLYWGPTEHWQRVRIVQMRAVESGKWIVRAASSGVSVIVDPTGNVKQFADVGQETVITGPAQLMDGMTPYHQWGWKAVYVVWWAALAWRFLKPKPRISIA